MNEILEHLQKLPSPVSIIVLIASITFLLITRWDSILKTLKLTLKKNDEKDRSCGDCVLILFGIREKYEYMDRRLDTNLLRMQMKFAEQKIQEVIFFLSQSFSEDIKILGSGAEYDRTATQAALYCETLKNAMLSTKDEIRRSIKENGFEELSENEFSYYVKDKTKTMVTIVRSYLNQHYIQTDKTIVNLKDRFDKMDKFHMQKFESWAFEIFINAKDLTIDTARKKVRIQEGLSDEINKFVKIGIYIADNPI